MIPHSTLTFTHAASFLCSIASDLALKERIWSISDPYIFQSLIQTFGSATTSACKTPHIRRTLFSLPLATLPWTAHKKQNKKKARVFSCFQADSSLGKGPNYFEISWDNSTFHALHVDVTTFWCHMENSSFFTTVVMSTSLLQTSLASLQTSAEKTTEIFDDSCAKIEQPILFDALLEKRAKEFYKKGTRTFCVLV